MKGIGERLRTLRKSTMMSQEKFAKVIGSSQFLRTNVPEGIDYEFTPRFDTDNKQFKQFIDMCFDPESPLNGKLKKSLYNLLLDGDK